MRNVHDALWRRIFAQPRHAARLLRLALASADAAAIDWSTLQECPAVWFDDGLRRSEADLVFLVRRKDGTWDAFLVEHKRTGGRGAVLQLLRYASHVLMQLLLRGLRVRLHIVLAHVGTRSWRGPVSLRDLMPDGGCAPHLALEPVLLDFAAWSPAQLRAADLTPAGRACIAAQTCLQGMRVDELEDRLREWQDVWEELGRDGPESPDQRAIERYLVRTAGLRMGDLRPWMKNARRKPMGSEWITFEEACHRYHEQRSRARGLSVGRKEGRAQGRAEGLEEGREEGRRMARIELLLQLLETRFGPAARRLRPRLQQATEAQLDRWALRLLEAPTLAAVFGRGRLAQRAVARAPRGRRTAATCRKRRRVR